MIKIYTREEAISKSTEYFKGDELAANVFVTKYALRNEKLELVEATPEQMHRRLAKEFARIEKKYPNPMSEEEIFELFDGFKHVCITGDTWITTSNGAIRVKDLIGKPFIAIVDGNLYRSTKEGFYITGTKKKVWKITTNEGYYFRATDNHKVAVHTNLGDWLKKKHYTWKEVRELKKGDKLVLHDHCKNWWEGKGSRDEGWLLGNLYGDGTFQSDNSATLSFMSPKTYLEEKEIALKTLNRTVQTRGNKDLNGCNGNNIGSITSKGLSDLASRFGMKKGEKKTLVDNIEGTSYDFYCGFLSGWFDADGTVSDKGKDNTIRLSCIDLDYLYMAQRMLARLGIISTIYKNRKDGGIKNICGRITNCQPYHDLVISKKNVLLFKEKINFQFRDKREKLEKMIESKKWNKDRYFARIENIIFDGEEDVYDCTIPEVSCFDGNGFYLHNCPQGSPMFGIGNQYQKASLSNCFVIDVADSYGGICRADERIAQIAKRRGGVGMNISAIRPKGMPTKNSALTTDGIIAFMDRFSNTTREVAQSGRHGALMLSISVHHPEILNFIRSKRDLKKVTGANISVQVTDEFMEAVNKRTTYEQRWPVDSDKPSMKQEVKAKEIWDELVKSNWMSGEPGILFIDSIINNSPADSYSAMGYRTSGTNPCGELPIPANSKMGVIGSCILLLQNLTSYIKNPFTADAILDEELLRINTQKSQRLIDDMVDLEIEAVDKIIRKVESDPEDEKVKANELDLWHSVRKTCAESRRTGLGVTGLGDAIAMLNIKYGSKESLEVIEQIFSIIRNESYRSSIRMAKERGAFSMWNAKLEKDNLFLNRLPKDIREEMAKVGRRNISCLTVPPAGSVSTLTQTSSGFEPVFMAEYTRKRKLMESDKDTADFVDQMGDKWKNYKVEHHGLKLFKMVTGKEFKDSPYFGAQAEEINYEMRVKMQGIATSYVDHAISSTINLPKDVDVKTIEKLYLMAHTEGCKGLTIYREGSRDGVLTKDASTNTRSCDDCDEAGKQLKELIKAGHRPKRILPSSAPTRDLTMPCEIHRSKVGKGDWIFFVGMLGGQPYEVFGGNSSKFSLPHNKQAWIVKNGKNKAGITQYNLVMGSLTDENEKFEVKDINNHFNNKQYGATTRLISLNLRHGVPIRFICEQITKTGCAGDFFSFQRAMSRILKKYIADGESSGTECPMCKSTDVYYKNGCPTCKICGNSNCS